MNEKEARRLLRQWDPAAGAETPTAELHARLRSRLAKTAEPASRPRPAGWLGSRWALVAATAAGALLVAVTVFRVDRSTRRVGAATAAPPGAEELAVEGEPLRVVYTASNGVRVYWSVPAAGSRL